MKFLLISKPDTYTLHILLLYFEPPSLGQKKKTCNNSTVQTNQIIPFTLWEYLAAYILMNILYVYFDVL